MTVEILSLSLGSAAPQTHDVTFLGQSVRVKRLALVSLEGMAAAIWEHDGKVAAIALEGIAAELRLGQRREILRSAVPLFQSARTTPVVDGSGVRDALERWAVSLVSERHPGTFSGRRILMAPSLNHDGLRQALATYTDQLHFADNVIYFALASAIASQTGLARYAGQALRQLRRSQPTLLWPAAGQPAQKRADGPFRWADVIAGDAATIRRYAPTDLSGKTIVVEAASPEDEVAFRERRARRLITTMPPLAQQSGEPGQLIARFPAGIVEAILAALRSDARTPVTESDYLEMIGDLAWEPAVVSLQGHGAEASRFAYLWQPLDVQALQRVPNFGLSRVLPDRMTQRAAAELPPIHLGSIQGIQSAATGRTVEGVLLGMGATPAELTQHDAGFAYRRLARAAAMAEKMGARLLGTAAFAAITAETSVTVAHESEIGLTSGYSLTIAATLEAAGAILEHMGVEGLADATALVADATGPVGAICARLLAASARRVILVASRPDRLLALQRQIKAETPTAAIALATGLDEHLHEADLLVLGSSQLDARPDITRCRPGAVVCDLARPPLLGMAEAAVRQDVVIIESAEMRAPGALVQSVDLGLPPGLVHPCLAEAAVLSLEDRFDDFSRGLSVTRGQVEEIYDLARFHGFEVAGVRCFGRFLSFEEIAVRRQVADQLRARPEALEQIRLAGLVAAETADSPDASPLGDVWPAGLAGLGVATAIIGWWSRRRTGGED